MEDVIMNLKTIRLTIYTVSKKWLGIKPIKTTQNKRSKFLLRHLLESLQFPKPQ